MIVQEIPHVGLVLVAHPDTMPRMTTDTILTATSYGYTLHHDGAEWDIFQRPNGEWQATSYADKIYCDPQPTRYDAISGVAGWDVADAIGRKRNATVRRVGMRHITQG